MHRRKWTDKEITFLYTNYNSMDVANIARILRRSMNSVKRKAQNEGLNAWVGEGMYSKALADCFHSDKSIVKVWMTKHGLPFTPIQRGQLGMYIISQSDFWEWAESHKDIVPWHKYELLSVLPEPAWVATAVKEDFKLRKNTRKKISDKDRYYVLYDYLHGMDVDAVALKYQRTQISIYHILRDKQTQEVYHQMRTTI